MKPQLIDGTKANLLTAVGVSGTTITRATIDAITDEKLASGSSNAPVNRTLALLRAILRKCANEWEWLDRAPQVRMLREPVCELAVAISLTRMELVGREGIEPSTNGLRAAVGGYRHIANQVLAALANLEINVVRSQFGHSQSKLVTNGNRDTSVQKLCG